MAPAQEVEGPLSPAGQLRVGIAPAVWTADSRFGRRSADGSMIEEVEPLGFDLSSDRLGATAVPGLSGVQDALREALDQPGFVVSLGRSRARVQETRIEVPVRLDLGITDWLTVGTTLPFVKRRSEVTFLLQADTATADLGVSPGVSAAGSTQLFLESLSGAVDAMATTTDDLCASAPGSSECEAAQQALAEGRTFRDALDRAYGGSFFPFEESGTGADLRSRLGSIATSFADFGVTSVPAPSSLPLAEGPLDQDQFQQILAQPGFGILGAPLETWESRWELGDMEIHGAVKLFERTQPEEAGFFERPYVLLGVGGLVRLGTGATHGPDNFVDVGSGDGQTDLELRAFGDLGFARRVGLWADVRYGIQTEGRVFRRIAPPEAFLPPLSSRAPVTWNPGDYLQLEAAPRWRLTPELAVAARYRFRTEGEDDYRLAEGASGDLPDPSLLEEETGGTLHEAGLSLVFSTLATVRAGRTGLPLEARVRYQRAVAGSGGRTRKGSRYEAGLRLFWRIWGE